MVNYDENIAPVEPVSPSPSESKSRRKAPRSQVRKIVRENVESKAQQKTSEAQPVVKFKISSKESVQKPECHESASKESFEQPECQESNQKNTATRTVAASPRNENIGIRQGCEAGNVATSETTV